MNLSAQLGQLQLGDAQLGNPGEAAAVEGTQTITGVARISGTTTQTITGISRIAALGTQTIDGTYLIFSPTPDPCQPITVSKIVPMAFNLEPCERKGS